MKREVFCLIGFALCLLLVTIPKDSKAKTDETLPIITLWDSLMHQKIDNEQIGFIEDEEALLSFDNFVHQQLDTFQTRGMGSIAQKDFNYWAVLKFKNPSSFKKTWWLRVRDNYVYVRILAANKPSEEFRAGNLVKQRERTIPNQIRPLSYIPITIEPNGVVELRMNGRTTSAFPFHADYLEVGLPLYYENAESGRLGQTSFIDGLYGAILLMFCLYCLGLWIFTKEKFAFWAIAYGIALLCYFYQFNYTWYRMGLPPVFILQAGISTMHFAFLINFIMSREYLNMKVHFPFWDKVYQYSSYYAIFLIFVHGAYHHFYQHYINAVYGITFSHAILYIPMIIFGVILIRHKKPLTIIFGVGLIIYNTILIGNNLINGPLSPASYEPLKIAVIFYVLSIIFSFSYRAAESRKQKIKIEAERLFDLAKLGELEKLDKIKSNFFANVSHELRTPLALMIGPINSVLKNEKLANRDFTLLKKAQQSGKDLLKLVASILDLSKMEAGKMVVKECPIILFSFVQRIVASFESHAQYNGILLTFEFQPEKSLQISTDVEKLAVILNNLLSNATKFTPSGGTVQVSVTDIGNAIQIVIKDTGRGIHSDDLPHIFNRFYQSSQLDAPSEGGTGIGLSLSKKYSKILQGELTVKSELGEGSTFILKIPRVEVMQMMPERAIPKIHQERVIVKEKRTIDENRNNPNLLIVEDNVSLRGYLSTILSPFYGVKTAENGIAALAYLNSEKTKQPNSLPNLIISDIMMPEMDGFQLLSALKEKDNFKSIPVIMLTARADIEDKLKALRIGVDDYLLKPFIEEELLTRIENLINNARERLVYSEVTEVATATETTISKSESEWLAKVEQLAFDHIQDTQFSVSTLAGLLFMSDRSLLRRIKKLTGLSTNQYLQEIRFNEARRILEQGQFNSVAKVAQAVGFSDGKTFSKRFKQRFGKSPAQY